MGDQALRRLVAVAIGIVVLGVVGCVVALSATTGPGGGEGPTTSTRPPAVSPP